MMDRQHALLLATFLLGIMVNMITNYWFAVAEPTVQAFTAIILVLAVMTYYLFKKGRGVKL